MSTYTSSLGLEQITPGSQGGLWGNTTNNTLSLIDQAVTGVTPISFASASGSTYTLTDYNGALDEARSAVINITGSAIGANNIVIPNKQKTYLVRNNSGQDVVFKTASPSATYTVGAGFSILVFCDGNNNVYTGIQSPSTGTLAVSGGGTGATTFGSGGVVKSSGGTSALTAGQVDVTTDITGTLPVANGGTGRSTIASGALMTGNGAGAIGTLLGTSIGQTPYWNGSTWEAGNIQGSTSASGYQKLPSGIIIQWGSCSSSGSGSPNVYATFPIAFPNAFLMAVITVSGPAGTTVYNGAFFALHPTSCTTTTLVATAYYTTGSSSGIGGRYIAIGY